MKTLRQYPAVLLAVTVGALAGVLHLAGAATVARTIIVVSVICFCLFTAYDMIRQIRAGHFGLDILALVAMISTLAVGEYWASLIIVVMLSGGEALEDYAEKRASRELTALLDHSPHTAHLALSDTESRDIPVNAVTAGDELLVRPAETVPVDSKLLSESSSLDLSSLTGESLPVHVLRGQEIPSGALNGNTAIRVRAVRPASESQYQQIIRLVEEAQASQAPVVRIADRFAIPFTLVSLMIAGAAWWISGDPVRFAEVLVLATPCPLLIAAPVAFMGGMSRSAKNGVIVKGGAVLERAARTGSLAFDKTGTLTSGTPSVVRVEGPSDTLRMAAAAEHYSTHVLAEGIRDAAAGLELPSVTHAEEIPGEGVIATIDGHEVRVGRRSFAGGPSYQLGPGEVAVLVSCDNDPLGAVILSDAIRPEAAPLVEWLHTQGIDEVAMVTGDTQAAAEAVADAVGIGSTHGDLRPADKIRVVKELSPPPTMMVGDGVNDAPVLASADVGVAMGAKGSTAAGEAADAVILRDSLTGVAHLIAIARHTVTTALTAIWLGVILSVVLMLIAATGAIPAVAGALGQEVLDLVAILYALRALGGKLPDLPSAPTPKAARVEFVRSS